MTGGLAFILDDEAWLDAKAPPSSAQLPFASFVNKETVKLVKLRPSFSTALKFLKDTLEQHVTETGSKRAQRVLDNLNLASTKITMVVPASEQSNALVVEDVTSDVSNSAKV